MNARVERITKRLEELALISNDRDCLSRFFGTPAHNKAKDLLISWMKEAGLEVVCDSIGNDREICKSDSKNAKHFVIESHTVLPFHLNIVSFSDEEGSRFNTLFGKSCFSW